MKLTTKGLHPVNGVAVKVGVGGPWIHTCLILVLVPQGLNADNLTS